MKIHGIKREWSHPIFCMKKHYCPYCNEGLEKTKSPSTAGSDRREYMEDISELILSILFMPFKSKYDN